MLEYIPSKPITHCGPVSSLREEGRTFARPYSFEMIFSRYATAGTM